MNKPYQSGTSTPSYLGGQQSSLREQRPREPYPSWTVENQIPMSKEEIEDVFIDLTNKFGFQRDSSRNQYDHLMIQLDSRSSRMSPEQALTTLHADYIGGEHANYRRWYFAAQVCFPPSFIHPAYHLPARPRRRNWKVKQWRVLFRERKQGETHVSRPKITRICKEPLAPSYAHNVAIRQASPDSFVPSLLG